jgi:hypothetical protein
MSNNTQSVRRFRVSPALVLSVMALFAALSGAAVALPGQSTVDSGDIKDNKVKSEDLRDAEAVANADVVPNSLSSSALAPGSVNSSEIGDGIHTHQNSVNVAGGVLENARYDVGSVTASCGAGEELISGSGHWSNEGANDELFLQEVELGHGAETVTVSGGNDTDQNRTLVAVAHCL